MAARGTCCGKGEGLVGVDRDAQDGGDGDADD